MSPVRPEVEVALIAAVVPACGRSARMGRPKLSLPLGGRTVIEQVVAALRDGGADPVLVVVGPHVPELTTLAEAAGAVVCQLPEPTADMRATVEHGLRWLEERRRPRPEDFWLLAPADHPALDAGVVRRLCAAAAADPARSIAVPVCGGRRGHPTLIAWRHVEGIRALPAGLGVNAYLRRFDSETLEVPVADPGVLADLDTPEDYDQLRESRPGGQGR
jgi:molybdenum cofactor cytidylyltransferase